MMSGHFERPAQIAKKTEKAGIDFPVFCWHKLKVFFNYRPRNKYFKSINSLKNDHRYSSHSSNFPH